MRVSQVGLAGVFCGATLSGIGLSWFIGRRMPMLVGTPVSFFAALLFAASSAFLPLVIERFLVGAGIGAVLQSYALLRQFARLYRLIHLELLLYQLKYQLNINYVL